jgi:GNAT superfamily N-acetyltransferase
MKCALERFIAQATSQGFTWLPAWSPDGSVDPKVLQVGNTKYPTIEFFEGCRVAFDSRERHIAPKKNGIWICNANSEKEVAIAMLVTDREKRKQGLANKTLDKILEIAKQANVDICLESATQDKKNGMTDSKLLKWYKRKGFVQKGEWFTLLIHRVNG